MNSPKPLSPSKTCWICHGTDEEEEDPELWVNPCKCKGTCQWVHDACILRWIDQKKKVSQEKVVECSQCKAPYSVIYTYDPSYFRHLSWIEDKIILLYYRSYIILRLLYTYVVRFAIAVSFYCVALAYGAISVLVVYGITEGMNMLGNMGIPGFFGGLPLFPVLIGAAEYIDWEQPVLKFLRTYVPKIPNVRDMLPIFNFKPDKDQKLRVAYVQPKRDWETTIVRNFSCIILFPMFCVICGNVFFGSVQGSLTRVVLGGLLYLLAKSSFRIFLLQARYVHHKSRRVLSWNKREVPT